MGPSPTPWTRGLTPKHQGTDTPGSTPRAGVVNTPSSRGYDAQGPNLTLHSSSSAQMGPFDPSEFVTASRVLRRVNL